MEISTSCAAEIRLAQLKELPFKQEFALTNAGYKIGPRDPNVNPGHQGKFMITDPEDGENGYAIVGDDRTALIAEAYEHLCEPEVSTESHRG
jgi:hypothetical protein